VLQRPASALAVISAVTVALLAGCATAAPTATPSPIISSATPAPIPPSGDGVFRVGTLAPLTGVSAVRGAAHVAAAEIAVRDVGIAGGVLGAPVELMHRDAGDASTQMAETSFAELVEWGADVVIGPSESALVERLAPLAAAAGVTLLVPGADSAVVGASDPGDSLFRVSPPLTAQVAALGRSLVANRVDSIALLTGPGPEGAALIDALRRALEGAAVDLIVPDPLSATTNTRALARELLSPEPGDGAAAAPRPVKAVIVATSADLAAPTLAGVTALIDEGLSPDRVWMLGGSLVDYAGIAGAENLDGANGVSPGAAMSDRFRALLRQSDPGIPSFALAAEVYDAVILAALAAQLAGDDGGPSIAGSLRAASLGGVPCTSYGACLDVIAQDREPDYDGLTGLLTIDEAGDVVSATLALFRYSATGSPERSGEYLY
jgi:branched-chain amino acid transport system substrate-binding protein